MTTETAADRKIALTLKAQQLLGLPLPLREVLRVCGVRQEAIARMVKINVPRVSRVLGSLKEAKKQGYDVSVAVFKTAAKLLGIPVETIPEYRDLVNIQQREQEL